MFQQREKFEQEKNELKTQLESEVTQLQESLQKLQKVRMHVGRHWTCLSVVAQEAQRWIKTA